VRLILRLAMKAIPLRHDDVPLAVLFEDEHLLAVNKPPGVLTAPKHRYAVRLRFRRPGAVTSGRVPLAVNLICSCLVVGPIANPWKQLSWSFI